MKPVEPAPGCPFCSLPDDRVLARTAHALAIRDRFPISSGHTLVLPSRHVASFFGTSEAERRDILSLIDRVKRDLDREYRPAGYNIGINDGRAAGQTVPHLHVHVIPRYEGDREDPRGGVRWILPERARYWES